MDGVVGEPAEPARVREVVQGDDRSEPQVEGGVDHPAVVGELGSGELPGDRLDARPLDAEAVGVEPGLGQQAHVLGEAVVAVDRVAAALHAGHLLLEGPPVAVDVVAFHLVRRGGRTPEEAVGKVPPLVLH